MLQWQKLGALGCVLAGILLLVSLAEAGPWTRRQIAALPDTAFASIEVTAAGKKVRHLPHHTPTGTVDPPHLLNALARLPQVQWVDPGNRETAERHLREHLQTYRAERVAKSRVAFPLNLNTASMTELMELPFIGRQRAQAIVALRSQRQGFGAVEELKQVKGIGPVVFEAVVDLVTIRPGSAPQGHHRGD